MTSGKIVIAGATAVFSLPKIAGAFERLGFSVKFIDADFMKPFETEGGIEFVSCSGNCLSGIRAIEGDDFSGEAVVVPLTEYWISQVIKNPGWCRISDVALKSSRSKKFFYEFMAYNGFYAPKLFENEEEARAFVEAAIENQILVKPDSLNSGYGIEVVGKENLELLSKYVYQAKKLKNHATRLFEIENTGVIFTERIIGTEYSADCFCFNGKISVVRICKKEIEIIHDKPCCVTYQVLEPTDPDGKISAEFSNCEKNLKSWCEKLFSPDDISFAQFDFILTGNGEFYPIDFAPRIGGGLKELLFEYEATRGVNVYAEAILKTGTSTGEMIRSSKKPATALTQLNILPRFSGYITDDNYNLPDGKQIIYKKKGDYVTSNPTSASSRIAIVICERLPLLNS